MKKSILIAGVFGLLSTSSMALTVNGLSGEWKGVGTQPSGSMWSINLKIKRGHAFVRYPSLNCGSPLQLIGSDNYKVSFLENLSYGKNKEVGFFFKETVGNCSDGGTIELSRINDNTLFFNWHKGSELGVGILTNKW